nr:PHP domain-containing protein [Pectinatus frisingensis]
MPKGVITILFDCHTHTEFSADSVMKLTDALDIAQKLNIGLITTEHIDFDFPGSDIYEFDPIEYFDHYRKYQYNNSLLLGVEIGMQKQTAVRSKIFSQQSPFDMIIISQHIIDGYDIYYPEYFYGKDKLTAYRIYLQAIANMISLHSFGDVLGHIDYICRKAPYDDKELYYNDFAPYIDKIWQTALVNNVIPEINTRRFSNDISIKTLIPVYRRYHELGGKYATIGSDAHVPASLGSGLKKACIFLKKCGLVPVYFKNHQLIPML